MGNNRLGPTSSGSEEESIDDGFFDLSFSVHKSRRYHEYMCAFYTRLRNLGKIFTVIAGSGLFILLTQNFQILGAAIAAMLGLWGMIDIILAPDKLADQHRMLRDKFIELAREVDTSEVSQHNLKRLRGIRLEVEKDEPPVKRLVDIRSRNDECRARGFGPQKLAPLSKSQIRFGYFMDFGIHRLEKWKSEQSS
jgi:hypothetical protein